MADEFLYQVRDGVATLTLNRPDQPNALTGEMLSALVEGVKRARDDEEVSFAPLTVIVGVFLALLLVSISGGHHHG